MRGLTHRKRQVLVAVRDFVRENGCPPSIRELGRLTGITSTNGVASHLNALMRDGYLERIGHEGAARSIRLTDLARTELGDDPTQGIPLLGSVVAGSPVTPAVDQGDRLGVDPALFRGDGALFALRVTGDSMIEDGILDGDVVIVRAGAPARDMDVVVAVVDGETTVKHYQPTPTGCLLVPANHRLGPIAVPETADFRVAGVVVGLLRSMV